MTDRIFLQPIFLPSSYEQYQRFMEDYNKDQTTQESPQVEANQPTEVDVESSATAKTEQAGATKTEEAAVPAKVAVAETQPVIAQSQTSWFNTVAKTTVVVGALASVGYGMYWYGAVQSAEIAGKAFEDFLENTVKMMPQDREAFFQSIQAKMIAVSEALPTDQQSMATALVGFGGRISALTEYARNNLSFNGELASEFKNRILNAMPAPSLNITGVSKEAFDQFASSTFVGKVSENVDKVASGVKYSGMGVGVAFGGWGANKLAAPLKFAVKVYSYTPFPGAYAIREALSRV